MKRIELAGEREIDRFESVAARVRRLAPDAHVVVIEIGACGKGGAASGSEAAVVRGRPRLGLGRRRDAGRHEIKAGEAVVWDAGEEHESGSDEGMTAILVEAEELDV